MHIDCEKCRGAHTYHSVEEGAWPKAHTAQAIYHTVCTTAAQAIAHIAQAIEYLRQLKLRLIQVMSCLSHSLSLSLAVSLSPLLVFPLTHSSEEMIYVLFHSRSHSLFLSHTHCLSHSLSLSLSHTLIDVSLTRVLLSLPYSFSLPPSLSLSLTLSFSPPSHAMAFPHILTRCLSDSLSLSLTLSVSPSHAMALSRSTFLALTRVVPSFTGCPSLVSQRCLFHSLPLSF